MFMRLWSFQQRSMVSVFLLGEVTLFSFFFVVGIEFSSAWIDQFDGIHNHVCQGLPTCKNIFEKMRPQVCVLCCVVFLFPHGPCAVHKTEDGMRVPSKPGSSVFNHHGQLLRQDPRTASSCCWVDTVSSGCQRFFFVCVFVCVFVRL